MDNWFSLESRIIFYSKNLVVANFFLTQMAQALLLDSIGGKQSIIILCVVRTFAFSTIMHTEARCNLVLAGYLAF